MLAGSVSSLQQAPAHGPSSGIPLQPLDERFAQMARVFEIASEATKARNNKCGAIANAHITAFLPSSSESHTLLAYPCHHQQQ